MEGETRILVPSPRDVPTYDHKPADERLRASPTSSWRALEGGEFDFVVVNYANADMVGHTGVISAAVAAVEAVDACLGRVVEAVARAGGVCLVTADHGNSDHMLEPDGSPNTAHSTNLVPFIATAAGCAGARRRPALRPGADGARPAGHRPAGRDDRRLPAGAGLMSDMLVQPRIVQCRT